MQTIAITLTVNGQEHALMVRPADTLLEVLRDHLDLTGAKEGCGEGVCGSCTVLLDDQPVRSCLTLALEADGHRVLTVEGLADGETLSDLQQSFVDHGAVQCGFCTPGMLMSSIALLNRTPDPDRTTIRQALSGNICRCTGYAKIVDAVAHTARPDTGCPDCAHRGKGEDHD
jgi:aerobic carbon-monoxide dehydrogenase small subunit